MGKLKGIIKASTDPKEYNGQIQIGFTLKDSDLWYNISGGEEGLKNIKNTLLKEGSEIEFDLNNGKVENL